MRAPDAVTRGTRRPDIARVGLGLALAAAIAGPLLLGRAAAAGRRPGGDECANLTVDSAFRVVSAAAVRDGVFVAVGRTEDVRTVRRVPGRA